MSALNVIINIFAVIGIVILLLYFISWLWKTMKNKTQERIHSAANPPNEYMQATGVRCPDYWINSGIDNNGNYICTNQYNISSRASTNSSCSNVTCPNQIKFSPMASGTTWVPGNPNGLTSLTDSQKQTFVTTQGSGEMSRCDWVNCCGPNDPANLSKINAGVWLGVNDICNANISS